VPLIDNPSMGLSVLLFLANVAVFTLSTVGMINVSNLTASCGSELRIFMLGVSCESTLNVAFFARLSFVENASDGEWAITACVAFCLYVIQVSMAAWGILSLVWAYSDEACFASGLDTINFATTCVCTCIGLNSMTILSVKFIFLPSIASQLRGLRDFK